MEKGQEAAIQKALDYIKSHLDEDLSVQAIAKHVGYSQSYLRNVFHKATGKGIRPYAIEMRIDKARSLLRDTRISISEIALATGFETYKQFHKMFAKRAGCSPSEFRRSQGLSINTKAELISGNSEGGHWFYEPFKGAEWKKDFEAASGTWSQEPEYATGVSVEDGYLGFQRPLPENFFISFEARLIPEPGLPSAEIIMQLRNVSTRAMYCHVSLGKFGGAVGEFQPRGFGSQINTEAIPQRNRWVKIQLRLNDDTLTISMDDVAAFVYKDPFPLPLYARNNLLLGAHNGRVQIREFVVSDLGFQTFVRNVRAGDSLYNTGSFSAARDFYVRLLASKVSTSDSMELRYKIGQCFLAEQDYLQARTWMEKVVNLPETVFWARQASQGLLEINLREERNTGIAEQLRVLFNDRILRNGAREIMDQVCSSYASRGFLEKALFLRSMLSEMETVEVIPAIAAEANLAETLFQLRRHDEAEDHFRKALAMPGLPEAMRVYTMFSFCSTLALQGKLEEWKITLDKIESISKQHPLVLCRLDILRALYFRAKGEFDKALDKLTAIHAKYPAVSHWRVIGNFYAALLHLAMGNVEKARKTILDAKKIDERHPWLNVGFRNWSHYPVELASGNFETAARYLTEDAQANSGSISGAEYGIKAGIMLYLADKKEEALSTWARIAQTHIETRFYFLGTFADSLARGKIPTVDVMPLAADRFSEMLYLLGLLCEKRGEPEQSREFFEQCINTDPLLGWPAWHAKQKLSA